MDGWRMSQFAIFAGDGSERRPQTEDGTVQRDTRGVGFMDLFLGDIKVLLRGCYITESKGEERGCICIF